MKFLLPILALWAANAALAETRTYKVDFGTEESPVGEGFQGVEALPLKATCDLSIGMSDEAGKNPINLQFHGDVGGYSLGNKEKPITTDGLYTFGSNNKDPKDIAFTISGLPPKALVTMYAVGAWNGSGRAAFLSLGDRSIVDIAGDPKNDTADPLALTDYAVVADRVEVGPNGQLDGVFSNSDGANIRAEGQWGAMILVVETH